jgi:hypothetical protein
MAIDFDHFWDESDEGKRPGITQEKVAAWEARHGVALPKVLRAALKRQNGGLVRYSTVRVLPLEKMAPAEDSSGRMPITARRRCPTVAACSRSPGGTTANRVIS